MPQRPQPVVTHAMIVAVLSSGVALAAYLFKLTPELTALITGFGMAVIVVFMAFFVTRDQVTPVSDPLLPEGTPVKTSTTDAVPTATVVTDGL
jgi:hypothetical protein